MLPVVEPRPIRIINQQALDATFEQREPVNSTVSTNTSLIEDVNKIETQTKTFNLSSIIILRKNDWRDAHEGKMIIWSLESHNHPDYGKAIARGMKDKQRSTSSSQLMSFVILGSVIGFILYTYLSHVVMQRKLDREVKAAELREFVRKSALLMAGAGGSADLVPPERKRSLINMFRGFKL